MSLKRIGRDVWERRKRVFVFVVDPSDATNAKGVLLQEGETSLDGETAYPVSRAERERKQRDLNANNRGRMMSMDSAASAAMNITFRGAISGAFEGHLQSYVDLERDKCSMASNEGRKPRRNIRETA